MASKKDILISDENVINRIYMIRGKKVMLDKDLAELYGVTTGNLNLAVRRNIDRFPDDFMFKLNKKEFDNLILQSATSSWGGTRKPPSAFTEQGVAMLSSVLRSKQAIAVNIQIMRVFTRMREVLVANKDALMKLEQLEKKMLRQNEKLNKHEEEIQIIFKALKQLLNPPQPPRKKIGYRKDDSD